jgi:hypothetical protein
MQNHLFFSDRLGPVFRCALRHFTYTPNRQVVELAYQLNSFADEAAGGERISI